MATTLVRKTGYQGATAIVVGTPQAAQNGVVVNCTVAGNVSFLMADGSTMVLAVPTGATVFDFSVQGVNTSGTTATATYFNLR